MAMVRRLVDASSSRCVLRGASWSIAIADNLLASYRYYCTLIVVTMLSGFVVL